MKKVGVCYHPKSEAGRLLAEGLRDALATRVDAVWLASAWEEEVTRAQVPDTELLFCVGGDGTVLRAARSAVAYSTLLVGVNLGRVGFLTELNGPAVMDHLAEILARRGRVEERAMLQASVVARDGTTSWGGAGDSHVLNDIVVGRAALGRTLQLTVIADGIKVADYRADGVILATATGSTAYSLALGGPVLYPESREVLVSPIAPHLSDRHSVVLPSTSVVEVEVAAGSSAALSLDGEAGPDLRPGDVVRASLSPHVTRFLRLGPPSEFYARVAQRLGWVQQPSTRGEPNSSAELLGARRRGGGGTP